MTKHNTEIISNTNYININVGLEKPVPEDRTGRIDLKSIIQNKLSKYGDINVTYPEESHKTKHKFDINTLGLISIGIETNSTEEISINLKTEIKDSVREKLNYLDFDITRVELQVM